MKAKRIQGFNEKEQAIYELLAADPDEPKSFSDMKLLFTKQARAQLKKYEGDYHKDAKELDTMAQSMSRNSIRRLVRDGWVEQCDRGTYQLTRAGKVRLKKGVETTVEFVERAPKKKKKSTAQKKQAKKKREAKKAAEAAAKKASRKKKAAKASPKKKRGRPKKSEAEKAPKKKRGRPRKVEAEPKKRGRPRKVEASKKKSNGVSAKAAAAAKRAAKEAAKQDTQRAARSAAARAAKAAEEEAN